MAVRRTGQMSLVEAFLGDRPGGSSGTLARIAVLVKWYRIEKLLAGINHDGPRPPRGGPPPAAHNRVMSRLPSWKSARRRFLSNLPTLVLGTSWITAQFSGSCHLATLSARKSRS